MYCLLGLVLDSSLCFIILYCISAKQCAYILAEGWGSFGAQDDEFLFVYVQE